MVRSDVLSTTERALHLALEYCERANSGEHLELPRALTVHVDRGKIAWAEGGAGPLPGAIVHASLQDRDFEPLHVGDPLFEGLDGAFVPYDGALGDTVVPIFINEAAYYYAASGLGIMITEALEWPVPVSAALM
jgi:hypothetical protein